MTNFTPIELFNKLYKYLERSLFDKCWVHFPVIENKKCFYVLKEGRIIIQFFLANDVICYQTNFILSNVIRTEEDVDCALKECDEIVCDNDFSLILKCNLI